MNEPVEIGKAISPPDMRESVLISGSTRDHLNLAISTLAIASIIILFLLWGLLNAADYIGRDNDDVMRLVQIRDLFAGQGWFDLQQYRLGLDGGTLMHWSRIIDAPMAGMMILFSWFTSVERAEFLAVTIWPLILIFPFIWAAGLGGFHLGGRRAMFMAQILTAVFIFSVHRFHPGSIDHHNAQMTLLAIIIAMILDPEKKSLSFAIAGFAAAIALVIGIETTPIVAVLAVTIAGLWGIQGESYRRPAIVFGSSFATFVAIAFFLFIPASRYLVVTCDNFSFTFASLSVTGGALLCASALLSKGKSLKFRLACLIGCGSIVAVMLLKIAPQCLQDPFASFDPMLITLWLNNVSETKSFFSELHDDPATIGAFYAVGFISILICANRIWKGENVTAYSILFIASLASFILSCYQIRGFIFASTISAFPISALIADLHKAYRAEPTNAKAALGFLGMSLMGTPMAWGLGGTLLSQIGQTVAAPVTTGEVGDRKICREKSDMAQLASLPPGLVAGDSNIGAHILRYTKSSVLAAPYHRNPNGILKELKIEMASLPDAEKMMRDINVRYYVVCNTDQKSGGTIAASPDGFRANVQKGNTPAYLEKLPKPTDSNLTVYVLRPPLQAS